MSIIKKKILLIETLTQVIKDLHYGKKKEAFSLLHEMKKISEEMEPNIQKDVQNFIVQVTFELDYDPEHLVTEEVRKAADKIFHNLGYKPRSTQ